MKLQFFLMFNKGEFMKLIVFFNFKTVAYSSYF